LADENWLSYQIVVPSDRLQPSFGCACRDDDWNDWCIMTPAMEVLEIESVIMGLFDGCAVECIRANLKF
jgi:hypothetical protein